MFIEFANLDKCFEQYKKFKKTQDLESKFTVVNSSAAVYVMMQFLMTHGSQKYLFTGGKYYAS